MNKYVPTNIPLTRMQDLSTLVEHKRVSSFADCELNVFETHAIADRVELRFDQPVVAAMLRGKKIMHLEGKEAFDFYPGESLILPSSEKMVIDFPEAQPKNPTQCIALTINEIFIKDTLNHFNEQMPKCELGDAWALNMNNYHLDNSAEITSTLNRLVELSGEQHTARDTFAHFALHELLLRLMQTQARHVLINEYRSRMNDHRLAFVIHYIKEHLTDHLTMDQLSDMACMSRPHFFRSFKRELGISPLEFILRERIRYSCKLLKNLKLTTTDVAYRSGFNNFNHFVAIFRRFTNHTPASYRKSQLIS